MKKSKGLIWIVSLLVAGMLTACGGAPSGQGGERPAGEQPAERPAAEPAAEQPAEGPAVSQPAEEPAAEPAQEEPSEGQSAEEHPPEGAPPTAKEAAKTVARALKTGNLKEVAKWAHREKGVRFSPYAYVDVEKDLVFSREELEGLMEDETVYTWGTAAGSGEPIELTYAEYHQRFVYDAAFFEDAEVAENETLGQSTTTNNIAEVYPPDTYAFVEYYIDGVDPASEGMDWRSLRLVFEKFGDDHALVGIVHDQWTP